MISPKNRYLCSCMTKHKSNKFKIMMLVVLAVVVIAMNIELVPHVMKVIVLTGYRDFQYAQEAIRLGVTRFLLKPSKMADINEALRAVTERLDKAVPAESDEQREHSGSFLVRQATAYIENHYAEKLTLQDVADACFVSQWHLSKLLTPTNTATPCRCQPGRRIARLDYIDKQRCGAFQRRIRLSVLIAQFPFSSSCRRSTARRRNRWPKSASGCPTAGFWCCRPCPAWRPAACS